MKQIIKQRVFDSNVEAYKDFLCEHIKDNKYTAIKIWISDKILGQNKIQKENAIAFFEAEGLVLHELIKDSEINEAEKLISLFNSFNNKKVTALELEILINAMRLEPESLSKNQENFKNILDTFKVLNNDFNDVVITVKLEEATKMLGEAGEQIDLDF